VPVSSEEIRTHLHELYFRDPDAQLFRFVARHLADPVKPEDEKGRFRLNRLILWLSAAGLFVVGTFIYFSIQP
jgi:hypothetical protein